MSVFRLAQVFKPAVHPRHWAHRKSAPHHRFYAKVEIDWTTGCWNWTGHVGQNGYGQMGFEKKVVLAHRWSYEFFVRPLRPGEHIDHLCRNRRCVNWRHLEAVTQAENNQRSWNARTITACRRGHPRSVYGRKRLKKNTWDCRACTALAQRRARQRRKAAQQ